MTVLLQVLLRLLRIGVSGLYFYRVLRPRRHVMELVFALGLVMGAFDVICHVWPACDLYAPDAAFLPATLTALAEAAAVMVALHCLTDSQWPEILLFYSLSLLLSSLASLLLFWLSALYSGRSVAWIAAMQWNDLLGEFLAALLEMGLLLAAAEGVARHIRRQSPELRLAQFAPVIGAQAASAVVLLLLLWESGDRARMLPVLTILVLLYALADGVLLNAFRAFVRNEELQRRVDALQQAQTMQKAYYLSMDEQLRSAQRMRHDYKNVLLTVETLIAGGEMARARDFAAECSAALTGGQTRIYTGNEVLDAVLNNKAAQAQQSGIAFDVELTLPEPLSVEDVDLMSIFSNLLDNALEYLSALPEDLPRRLAVQGRVERGMWVLSFSNSYLDQRAPDFITSKADKAQHGYGMGIVRSLVEKYAGVLHIAVAGGMLTIRATLNLFSNPEGAKGKGH